MLKFHKERIWLTLMLLSHLSSNNLTGLMAVVKAKLNEQRSKNNLSFQDLLELTVTKNVVISSLYRLKMQKKNHKKSWRHWKYTIAYWFRTTLVLKWSNKNRRTLVKQNLVYSLDLRLIRNYLRKLFFVLTIRVLQRIQLLIHI